MSKETKKFAIFILVNILLVMGLVKYLDFQIKEKHKQYLSDGYMAKKECIRYRITYIKKDGYE